MTKEAKAKGTKADSWLLKTPPGTSDSSLYRDDDEDPPVMLRGRFGMYMPPLLEALGLAEVEHNPRGNRMRAK